MCNEHNRVLRSRVSARPPPPPRHEEAVGVVPVRPQRPMVRPRRLPPRDARREGPRREGEISAELEISAEIVHLPNLPLEGLCHRGVLGRVERAGRVHEAAAGPYVARRLPQQRTLQRRQRILGRAAARRAAARRAAVPGWGWRLVGRSTIGGTIEPHSLGAVPGCVLRPRPAPAEPWSGLGLGLGFGFGLRLGFRVSANRGVDGARRSMSRVRRPAPHRTPPAAGPRQALVGSRRAPRRVPAPPPCPAAAGGTAARRRRGRGRLGRPSRPARVSCRRCQHRGRAPGGLRFGFGFGFGLKLGLRLGLGLGSG
eukprot:scaffold92162_cov66-Phaeocystis_antarctica.AAC.2